MKNCFKPKKIRCSVCGKFLCQGEILNGIIQIKCKNCKNLETIVKK